MVWKHECSWVRKGGFPDRARTLFSTMVHSTSSSWITTSFFKIFMAYNSSVPFLSANITWRDSAKGNKWASNLAVMLFSSHWFTAFLWKYFSSTWLTLPKLPLPRTMMKLKSESLMRSWFPLLSYFKTEEEEEESVGFPGPTFALWREK